MQEGVSGTFQFSLATLAGVDVLKARLRQRAAIRPLSRPGMPGDLRQFCLVQVVSPSRFHA